MKKLILLLFIPLVFGCSNEPVNVFEYEFSNFEGLWSGLIGDISNGTWTFSIDELGVVSGSITSVEHNEMYSINGSVNESGYVESNVTSIQSSRNSTSLYIWLYRYHELTYSNCVSIVIYHNN